MNLTVTSGARAVSLNTDGVGVGVIRRDYLASGTRAILREDRWCAGRCTIGLRAFAAHLMRGAVGVIKAPAGFRPDLETGSRHPPAATSAALVLAPPGFAATDLAPQLTNLRSTQRQPRSCRGKQMPPLSGFPQTPARPPRDMSC
jgi:hypothetical protein